MTSGALTGRGVSALLGTAVPVVQAPMAGGITTPALVAAACEAGALGSLGAAVSSPERIRADAAAIRALTSRPFGINLFVLDEPGTFTRDGEAESIARLASWRARYGLPPQQSPARVCESFAAQFDALLEAAPAVASFHFGIPSDDRLAALVRVGCRIVGGATNVAEARAWAKAGAHAIVAQGSEAGGHRGTFVGGFDEGAIGTMALVPRLADAVDVPVIAAGGIMDGRGIAAAFALGAQGVQMGTAFLACDESGAHPAWKAALAQADTRGTRLTRAFSGRQARGLVNEFMQAMRGHEAAMPVYPVQNALTGELRAAATRAGDVEAMSLWAGQGAALARPGSVAGLVARLVREYDAAVGGLVGSGGQARG
ncbi:MAG TPA: nitronate monooxygenase [Burkholderiaceae bacterium]|nr:nitronate monooxygenase [Burkholderiaceae bacterium]